MSITWFPIQCNIAIYGRSTKMKNILEIQKGYIFFLSYNCNILIPYIYTLKGEKEVHAVIPSKRNKIKNTKVVWV